MSLSKPAAVTKMESLPIYAIEELCRYLSEQDIAICSMVSRSWRETFNDDVIWKPLCCPRLQLEEHLRTTPCAVEPSFTPSVTPDSTLSTVCQWKIANMREKHLWNNIRRGECKETAINHDENKGFPITGGFLTDDLVFLIFAKSIEVWDIRVDPAVKVSVRAHSFTNNEIISFTVVGEEKNMAMTVHGFRVRLFNIDIQAGRIVETSVFDFDAIEEEKLRYSRYGVGYVPKYVCSGSFFLGVNRGCSNLLHLWDLNHDRKITEHSVDIPEFNVIDIFGSQTTTNILVVSAHEKQQINTKTQALKFFPIKDGQLVYMVYCMKKTNFLAFKYVSQLSIRYSCALLNEFVAIWDEHSLRIFNYKTSEQIYQGKGQFDHYSTNKKLVAVGDSFLFHSSSTFMIFNPKTKSSFVDNIRIGTFMFYRSGTITVLDELHHLGKSCFYTSEENSTYQLKHDNLEKIGAIDYTGMNSSCTRYLQVPKEETRSLVTVKQFW